MDKVVSRICNLRGWKRQFFAMICGGIASFSLAPYYLLPVCFIAFPVLVLLMDGISTIPELKTRLSNAMLTCWSFGFGYFVLSLWWLSNAMLVDPVGFAWAIPFAIFGLPAYLAIYWGFAGFIAITIWKKGASRFFSLAFAIGVGEYLRSTLLTGFPWASIGYTIMPIPLLMQSDAVVGLYAMNALAVLLYSIPTVFMTSERKTVALIIGMALLCAHIGFGIYRLHDLAPVDHYNNSNRWVRLIQPSVKQDEKLDNEVRLSTFQTNLELSSSKPAGITREPDFIVWPETSLPYILDYVPEVAMQIASILKPQQWAIIGAVRTEQLSQESDRRYFNTIEVINSDGTVIDHSDKLHLVPFGEYLPYQNLFDIIGLRGLADVAGGYTAATERKTVKMPNNFVYLPMICYEAIFPDGMNYEGATPQAILNVTNDAWFGSTPGPYQHFDQARLRAVELGIPLIRAANNGISAVVDPYGRIVASLGLNAINFLDAPVPEPIVPIWNNGPKIFHAFLVFCVILMLSITLGRSNGLRSIDNL